MTALVVLIANECFVAVNADIASFFIPVDVRVSTNDGELHMTKNIALWILVAPFLPLFFVILAISAFVILLQWGLRKTEEVIQ